MVFNIIAERIENECVTKAKANRSTVFGKRNFQVVRKAKNDALCTV